MLGTAQGYHRPGAQERAGLPGRAGGAGPQCAGALLLPGGGQRPPHAAIVDTAKAQGCDLIIMGSHGRHGMTGFLLGSETQRVLAQTKLPVLVLR